VIHINVSNANATILHFLHRAVMSTEYRENWDCKTSTVRLLVNFIF